MAKKTEKTAGIQKMGGLGDRTPVAALLNDDIEVGSFLTNADTNTNEGRDAIFKSQAPGDVDSDKLLGSSIDVVYWVCQKQEIYDRREDANKILVRTTIIDSDGHTFSTTSEGVLKSIDLLRGFYPVDIKYDPPVAMTLKATDTGKGVPFLMLVPISAVDGG